jgi:hypothetical protein
MTTLEDQLRLAFLARVNDLPVDVTTPPTLHALTTKAGAQHRRTLGFAAAAVAALAAIGGSLGGLAITGSPVPVTAMSSVPSATVLSASVPTPSQLNRPPIPIPSQVRSAPPPARPIPTQATQAPPVSIGLRSTSVTGADHVGSTRT